VKTWLTEDDFAEDSKGYHVWQHFVTVIIPENVDYSHGKFCCSAWRAPGVCLYL
jgi:hypothetical protein